jgi:general secretion pathway protein A
MYLNYYGLKESPFRLTPDPQFLHFAEPHRDALQALLQGIIHRKGFLVLTGPVGTGKTTLLFTLLRILTKWLGNDGRLVSAFLVNPTLTREELMETLIQEFGISTNATTKPQRLSALQELFGATYNRGGTGLILVDEAHLMDTSLLEEFRLLGNMEMQKGKPLQIVFSGQPELADILRQPRLSALSQRIAVRTKLRELSLTETQAYIAERLHAAGLKDGSPFSTASIEQIYRLSGGVPRTINILCDGCLTMGLETKRKQIAPDMVLDVAESMEIGIGGFGTIAEREVGLGRA